MGVGPKIWCLGEGEGYRLLQLPLEHVSSLDHQLSLVGGPQMNKFEPVSGLDHQMSEAGHRTGVPMSHVQGGLCTVKSNASWVMVTWDPVDRQTHMSENITFPRLCW